MRNRGRTAVAVGLAWALVGLTPLNAATTFSRSGQFVIHSFRPGALTLNRLAPPDLSARIALHPDLVAVGCERVKAALLAELNLRDDWRGKVHVRLLPGGAPDRRPRVGATRFVDGWQYSISSPDELEPAYFVEAVVKVLLLELANRIPGPYPAEVPLWLAEGLAAQILARVGTDLVPEHSPVLAKYDPTWGQLRPATRQGVATGDREATRALLREQSALTFRELSLPEDGVLDGDRGRLYRASAEVLVTELRRLPRGDAMLGEMLRRLTSRLNWQTAFLEAYASQFSSLLEVEKWWAIASFQFAVGQTALSWTPQRSLAAMAAALAVTIEVRHQAGDLPQRERVTLQEGLTRLSPEQINAVFEQKSRQLATLQVSLAPEVALLCQKYRDALEGRYVSLGAARALRALIDRFEALDQERAALEAAVRADLATSPG